METTAKTRRRRGLGVQVIARAASVLRALEGQARRTEPRSDRQRSRASPARPFSGSSPRWRRRTLSTEAQPGHGVRIGPGLARIAASLSSNYGRSYIPISSLCATRSAKPSIFRFCPAARPSSSTRLRASSGSSRYPRSASGSPSLHGQRQGDPRVFRQRGRRTLLAKSVAEHPDHRSKIARASAGA